jgi:hypothetical protein
MVVLTLNPGWNLSDTVMDTRPPESYGGVHIASVINRVHRTKELIDGLDWWKLDGHPSAGASGQCSLSAGVHGMWSRLYH